MEIEGDIFMKFNPNLRNYETLKAQDLRKVKEEKKEPEKAEKKEDRGAAVQQNSPKSEPLTANALDIMAMQHKGEMGLEQVQKGKVPVNPKDGGNIEELIAEWNAHHDDYEFEAKINLINSILELCGNDNDLRLHWVCIKNQTVYEQQAYLFQNTDTTNWTQQQVRDFYYATNALFLNYLSDDEINYLGHEVNSVEYHQLSSSQKIEILQSQIMRYSSDIEGCNFVLQHPNDFLPNEMESANQFITHCNELIEEYQSMIDELRPHATMDPGTPVNGVVAPEDPDPMEELAALQAQWESLADGNDYEAQFNVLTQIINIYTAQGDEDSARIWRVRRLTVNYNYMNEQYLQHLFNGAQGMPEIESLYLYAADGESILDYQAENYIISHGTTDEERSVLYEYVISSQTLQTLDEVTRKKNNSPDYHQNLLLNHAKEVFNNIDMATTFFDENEPWQSTFGQYKSKFERFREVMTNPNDIGNSLQVKPLDGGVAVSAVQIMVGELTGLIDQLREQGFPYCDELLISIQGYLIYAEHDDIDVLPYPEEG